MKKYVICIVLLFSLLQGSHAQFTDFCKIWVEQAGSKEKIQGFLYEVNDSSIIIAKTFSVSEYENGNIEFISVPINTISSVKWREYGQLMRHSLYYMLKTVTFFYPSWDDTRFYVNGKLKSGIYFLIPIVAVAGLIGAIKGFRKETAVLNGKNEEYEVHKSELKEKSIVYRHFFYSDQFIDLSKVFIRVL